MNKKIVTTTYKEIERQILLLRKDLEDWKKN